MAYEDQSESIERSDYALCWEALEPVLYYF